MRGCLDILAYLGEVDTLLQLCVVVGSPGQKTFEEHRIFRIPVFSSGKALNPKDPLGIEPQIVITVPRFRRRVKDDANVPLQLSSAVSQSSHHFIPFSVSGTTTLFGAVHGSLPFLEF